MHIHNLQSVLNKVMKPQMSIIKNIVVIQKYCLWDNENTPLSNARVKLQLLIQYKLWMWYTTVYTSVVDVVHNSLYIT